MARKTPTWEEPAPGIRVLKLYETELNPDWPRIVVLDLTAEKFREFEDDPLAFDNTYKLYPDQPVQWASTCQRPPEGLGIPAANKTARWMVVLVHGVGSTLTSAGSPFGWPNAQNP
ncbi:MAG: hypothetical protein ACRD3D_05895 [Terriglobia bacterium]